MAANLSVVLGPRVLGKEAFQAQQTAMSKESGSVGLGKAHDKPYVPTVKATTPVTPGPVDAPKISAPAKVAVPAGKGASKRGAAKPSGKKAAAPQETSFSEADVERLLAADPNAWMKIAEREAERPDGPRVKVALLLLEAGPKATTVPMPPEVQASLMALVKSNPE